MKFLYKGTLGSPPSPPDARAWRRSWTSQAITRDGKPTMFSMWFLPISPLWIWE